MADSANDNLEHVLVEWLQRLQRGEVPSEEVQSTLQVMNARLEFLRNLHSAIGPHAEQAAYVEQEIERQTEEIRTVERYIAQSGEESK